MLNKRIRLIMVIVISFLLVTSIFTVLFIVLRQKGPLTDHDPIIIWKDEDFIFYDFPGEGTRDNPFEIKNYNITTESKNGIYITNTTLHFIIQDCYIKAKDTGIYIEQVAEETFSIINNECSYNYNGIIISHSHSSLISNNTCEYNINTGISLINSNYSTIENNTCNFNGYDGIWLWITMNNTIISNTIHMNANGGIVLGVSSNTTIMNNYLSSNDCGITLWWSIHTQTCENYLLENRCGMEIHESTNGTVWMNYFQKNEEYAVNADGENEYIMIHHNSFIDNNLGGTCQAYSEYATEWWYDIILLEGNYWNDWISGLYQIDSVYPLFDLFPLTEPPV